MIYKLYLVRNYYKNKNIISLAFSQNKRKKELENRQKLIALNEARQLEKDEIMKLEILKRRNAIVEKALLKKWSDRDSTKALTRAVHKMEVRPIWLYILYNIY